MALGGSVNPEHSETTFYFEYGPCSTPAQCATSEYTGKTPATTSAVYGAVTSSTEIEGLTPASEYHYRLVGENQAGRVEGQNVTAATAPAPALVVVGGVAGEVTQTTAVISGTLNPNGLASAYGFQIGTEAGVYGPEVGIGSIGVGSYGPSTPTFALQNLQPGTTYHYRLMASNAYHAVVYGPDGTFTTAGASSPFAQPLALPLLATPTIAFPAEPSGSASGTSKPAAKCKRNKRGRCVKSKRKTKGRKKAHGKKQ
jgi:hypothetical protein